MNRLFVVNKPINISSNFYLKKIKRKYKVKKAGFSGTLDPFANGCLVVAFGKYPKLFPYLKKTPKSYRTTIWLGATSDSLDIENITNIKNIKNIDIKNIKNNLQSLKGDLKYLPPKYSAKRINGKRAYSLARDGIEFEMKQIVSTIYDVKFINYTHPFITFEISVSQGAYIRSIAQILLQRLDTIGTLSYLSRLNEGKFKFENEKALNPLEFLDLEQNSYTGSKQWFNLGKKLDISYFKKKENKKYLVVFDDFFAIIKIQNDEVKYILNKIILEKL